MLAVVRSHTVQKFSEKAKRNIKSKLEDTKKMARGRTRLRSILQGITDEYKLSCSLQKKGNTFAHEHAALSRPAHYNKKRRMENVSKVYNSKKRKKKTKLKN